MTEERKEYQRITDKEALNVIQKIKDNDENSLADALRVLIEVTVDTRAFLRKIYKNTLRRKSRNIVTDPTKAKKGDIVVGKGK